MTLVVCPPQMVEAGVSAPALAMRKVAAYLDAGLSKPASDVRDHLLAQALQIFSSCSNPGWDGDHASPIRPDAMNAALDFICALPRGASIPDVVPEPGGTIGFEWRRGANKILVVSASPKRVLIYAAVLGDEGVAHGTRPFVGTVPNEIQELILDHFS